VRPRLLRRVGFQPDVTYFKPAGVRMIDLEESVVSVEEFEAVRLKDFKEMEQKKAAEKMNISQPTFHRLLLSARKKLADAIVNGKAIKIQGGSFKLSGKMKNCVCHECGFSIPKESGQPCFTLKCYECNGRMIRG